MIVNDFTDRFYDTVHILLIKFPFGLNVMEYFQN